MNVSSSTLAQGSDLGLSGLGAVLGFFAFEFVVIVHSQVYLGYTIPLTYKRLGRAENALFLGASLIFGLGIVVPMFFRVPAGFAVYSIGAGLVMYWATRQWLLALAPLAGLLLAAYFLWLDAWLVAAIAWHVPAAFLTILWRVRHPPLPSPPPPQPRSSPALASPDS